MKNNRRVPTAPMLMIRVACGVYLIYLAYCVFTMTGSEISRGLLIFFSLLFLAGGIIAAVYGLKDLIRGRYVGGPGEPVDVNAPESDAQEQGEEIK